MKATQNKSVPHFPWWQSPIQYFVIVSFKSPEFFPCAVMSLDNSSVEIKCKFKWTFTGLYIFFLDFIIFRGKWWKVIPCKIWPVKTCSIKTWSPALRHIKSKGENGKMFHWGCSFSEYAGMMSFVFIKPSLNLFLPFKNRSRVHLWRLSAFHISGC